MSRKRWDRDPAEGRISGVLDTGKGSKSGELSRDDIDALETRTERTGRLRTAAKALDEQRGKRWRQ